MDIAVPGLKPLHSVPILFFLAVINITLVTSLVYLALKRSDSFEKHQTELIKILNTCVAEKLRGDRGQ